MTMKVAETTTKEIEKSVSFSTDKYGKERRRRQRRRRNCSEDSKICVVIPLTLVVCCVMYSSMVISFVVSFSSRSAPRQQPPQRQFSTLSSTATMEERPVTEIANDDDDDDNSRCNNNFDVLASLFGSSEALEDFFAYDFGTNVVHVKRETSSNTIEDLDLPCIDKRDGSMVMKVIFDTTDYVALRKRGSLEFLEKTSQGYEDFCAYVQDGGSAVIPVAEENALMPFRSAIENSLRHQIRQLLQDENRDADGDDASCSVGINVYHSGPNAVALTRHVDQYDVFVLHLDGKKEWEIGVFGEDHVIDSRDPGAIQAVASWKNITLVPGDLLYIPKGIYHAATTAEGYDSTTHATVGLEY
jgi:hypothetical protein